MQAGLLQGPRRSCGPGSVTQPVAEEPPLPSVQYGPAGTWWGTSQGWNEPTQASTGKGGAGSCTAAACPGLAHGLSSGRCPLLTVYQAPGSPAPSP